MSYNLTAQSADVENTSTEVNLADRQIGEPLGQELRGTRGALVYDNGPHFNIAGNPNISLLQDQTLGQNTLGGGVSGAFSIADDFTLTATYDITAVDLYGYQTGAPTSPASISGVVIQIWDGDPSAGGSVIYGDFINNVWTGAAWSNTYRESESNPGTGRAIQLVNAELPGGVELAPGTYWIDWQYIGDAAFSGPWQPPVVELDVVVPGNGLQSNNGVYATWADTGDGSPLDAPFQLYGTEVLGVDDQAINNAVSVFPNPAVNEINISSNGLNLQNAEIYNIQGRLMQTVDLSSMGTQETVNIASYSAGVYLVKINGDNGSATKRFVKR
ncbi:T9SS type A sorting domain-containing protein [Aureitalea sp. L0-47]|uniref:T9SS type A sorting domain-containing protein n=1 Tax=Aureitalea sp. L0-47 TaxID=2816962 RepID=UPI0022379E5C|nr:T9SS type A sorting domain-containing protein [Aureitalea sp. L0-47]MCW5518334.1 T9SS type A sorting domain-containing protein [Aureitalea sp. L0-47]